jgi:hypothetical protein
MKVLIINKNILLSIKDNLELKLVSKCGSEENFLMLFPEITDTYG